WKIPFTDRISIDNAITCCCVLISLGYGIADIQERLSLLEPVEMRMQLKKAVNNCYLINDSYSNDLSSLALAMDYLKQQAGRQATTIILSDILQSRQPEDALYAEVAGMLSVRGIKRLIGIGPAITRHQDIIHSLNNSMLIELYPNTDDFLQKANAFHFRDEFILIKGARLFEFERISSRLELKLHQTVMEINLTAMLHNLKMFQQQIKPSTKMMAMVKAFGYGNGMTEVAGLLQFHRVDYLAVAYADEGVELRKAGIRLPIMVMNADEAGFDSLINCQLEPEIYSAQMYRNFHAYLLKQGIQQFPVHIKFNTGMNRLGWEPDEALLIAGLLVKHKTMLVKSVFSHLAASEDPELDYFTEQQISSFETACEILQTELGYPFLKHIANSAAIGRKPEWQFDMVRLGIGLYGIGNDSSLQLEPVTTLKSTIAQIRKLKSGDTVGYGRRGKINRDSVIATVRIGYADGYGRALGNGKGCMFLHGKLAPIIGDICMDMTMIDITEIPGVKEEDEVEIFGKNLGLQQLAQWANTISYEILTGISQRVKRVYLEE
ncbi:MAG: hypothetical protein RLZZ28_1405, partial [Bacteroidota bacterium]